MKTAADTKKKKIPAVTIDPTLNELKNQNLFPEKLAKANEMLKTARLPFERTTTHSMGQKSDNK